MVEPFRGKAWEMIAKESVHVDAFITPSNYSKELFIRKTGLKGDNIHLVPLGFDANFPEKVRNAQHPPTIGFFSRINKYNGIDKMVDAFIELKKKDTIPGLTLAICGGYTGDDKPFISKQISKIRENNLKKFVRIYPEFQGLKKEEFFNDVDIISVPVSKYDGYGLYILEANLAGIPVVQPATGAFPEILEMTGGGITYLPDTVEELANSILRLLTDEKLREDLGKTGHINVKSRLSLDSMSNGLEKVYKSIQ